MEKIEEEEIAKQIDEARADTKAAIERDMQQHFLLERIAKEEEIDVTEAEMVQAIEEIAQVYGHPVEQVLQSFNDRGRLAELRAEILHRKARESIRAAATLVEDPSLAEGEADATSGKKPAEKKAAKKKKPAKKKATAKKADK